MSYLSLEFFSAFVLFLGLYWLFAFSPRLQNLLLIAASYGIVASFNIDGTHFEYILLAYTLAVYVVSHIISRCRLKIINNMLVVVLVCSLLFVFKYYNFFLDVFQTALFNVGINPGLSPLSLLLPIGISFYSFHSASYLVSVKNKQIPPAPILDLVLYLCFFPSIIAGPINRATDFLAQIQNPSLRCVLDVRRALLLIAVAIGKLLLLSSWLAINFANPVFSSPSLYSPGQVLLGVYAYAFQIYFNFSGYTDLVTAMALLLGFRLPKNFDFPYLAQDLAEFWRRWHISLSSFIRDYVYIPLGGSRAGFFRTQFNLMLAMLLSGLWHGIGVNFIIWGGLNGLGLVFLNAWRNVFPGFGIFLKKFGLARIITFHYLCFTWVFFRSENLSDAFGMLESLSKLDFLALLQEDYAVLFVLVILFYPFLVAQAKRFAHALLSVHGVLYLVLVSIFIYIMIVFSPPGVPEFIYARF